jgi:hypothetical protein
MIMASNGEISMSLYESGVALNGFVGSGEERECRVVVIGGVTEVEVKRIDM